MPYSELPDEIAAILDLPEEFPELSTLELRKLRAYVRTHRLRLDAGQWQREVRSGVPGEVHDAMACRERLQMILRFNEELHANGDKGRGSANGTTWQEVRGKLLAELEAGTKPRSMDAWAEHLGCSKSTVQKAISKTPKLRANLRALQDTQPRTPRAQSLNDMVMETAEADGQNPADAAAERIDADEQKRLDAMLARLMDKATPEERACLNAKTRNELNELCRLALAQEGERRQARREEKTGIRNRKP